jgi:Na+/H+-translocating membrane pyrophosphatase
MRKEFPVLYAGASRYVVAPLSAIVLVFLVSTVFVAKEPSALYPVCITAFGVTISLAGLCFAFKPQVREAEVNAQMLYAGEKFSLAAILSLQLLFIAFCRDLAQNGEWFKAHPTFLVLLNAIFAGLWSLVSSSAVWCWY